MQLDIAHTADSCLHQQLTYPGLLQLTYGLVALPAGPMPGSHIARSCPRCNAVFVIKWQLASEKLKQQYANAPIVKRGSVDAKPLVSVSGSSYCSWGDTNISGGLYAGVVPWGMVSSAK